MRAGVRACLNMLGLTLLAPFVLVTSALTAHSVAPAGFTSTNAADSCSTPGFRAAAIFDSGGLGVSVAAGDFNSDGKPDLAVVNFSDSAGTVAILVGDGQGHFSLTDTYRVGRRPFSITASDFNNDGKTDLAVANFFSASVTLLRGDGTGKFITLVPDLNVGGGPISIAAADFNADGKADLAVANNSPGGIRILPGNGALGFGPESFFPVNALPAFIALGDLNADNKVDVVTVNEFSENVTVLLGNGAGGLGAPTNYTAGVSPRKAALADFNLDGKLDLAVSNNGSTFISLLPGLGDGSFAPAVNLNVGSGTGHIVAAELNGDNKPDLLAASDGSKSITVLLGQGGGAFSAPVNFATGPGANWITARDFNGDSKVDVAVTVNNGLALLNGDGAGAFEVAPTFPAGTQPAAVATADFNGDSKPDLAVANSGSNNVSLLLGAGAGAFLPATNFATGQRPQSLAAGDFNGDGKPDLATADVNSSTLSILTGDGIGGFAPPMGIAVGNPDFGSRPQFVTTADFNGDGKLDLVVLLSGTSTGGFAAVLLNNGAGGFGAPVNFAVGVQPVKAAVGDFNGDSKPDLAVVNLSSQSVFILVGNGTGGFNAASNIPVGAFPNAIAVADFNADSKADFAVGSGTPNLFLGDGAGGFTSITNFALFSTSSIVAADFTHDGLTDLALSRGDSVAVVTGNGAGGFGQPLNFSIAAAGPAALIAADLNGDGASDLVTANAGSANVSLLLQRTCGVAAPTMQFSAATYQLNEAAGHASLTIVRLGDNSGMSSVSYRTADADTFTNGCADTVNNQGGAYARCDFATVVGTVNFAAGETQKTVTVPLIDDGHVEGPETFQLILSNPIGGGLGVPATTTVTITDNDANATPNPIFSSPFFVRQQYLDFLSREPDQGGFDAWLSVLNNCSDVNNNPACDRILVSQSFFGSPEFQLKGFYVFRFYKLAFNRLPEYLEIIPDMSFVAGQTPAEVFARKAQLVVSFSQRPEFQTAYDNLSHAQYVAALLGRYQLASVTTPDPQQPDGTAKVTLTQAELVSHLDASTLTRAQVFRAVADSDQVSAAEFNNAFVAMQYYGYLRRKPEPDGYQAWLRVLQGGDIRTMVNGFMNSQEYKLRFGNPNQ